MQDEGNNVNSESPVIISNNINPYNAPQANQVPAPPPMNVPSFQFQMPTINTLTSLVTGSRTSSSPWNKFKDWAYQKFGGPGPRSNSNVKVASNIKPSIPSFEQKKMPIENNSIKQPPQIMNPLKKSFPTMNDLKMAKQKLERQKALKQQQQQQQRQNYFKKAQQQLRANLPKVPPRPFLGEGNLQADILYRKLQKSSQKLSKSIEQQIQKQKQQKRQNIEFQEMFNKAINQIKFIPQKKPQIKPQNPVLLTSNDLIMFDSQIPTKPVVQKFIPPQKKPQIKSQNPVLLTSNDLIMFDSQIPKSTKPEVQKSSFPVPPGRSIFSQTVSMQGKGTISGRKNNFISKPKQDSQTNQQKLPPGSFNFNIHPQEKAVLDLRAANRSKSAKKTGKTVLPQAVAKFVLQRPMIGSIDPPQMERQYWRTMKQPQFQLYLPGTPQRPIRQNVKFSFPMIYIPNDRDIARAGFDQIQDNINIPGYPLFNNAFNHNQYMTAIQGRYKSLIQTDQQGEAIVEAFRTKYSTRQKRLAFYKSHPTFLIFMLYNNLIRKGDFLFDQLIPPGAIQGSRYEVIKQTIPEYFDPFNLSTSNF